MFLIFKSLYTIYFLDSVGFRSVVSFDGANFVSLRNKIP